MLKGKAAIVIGSTSGIDLAIATSFAVEVAEHGITSNTICPGYVKTPLVDGQIAERARAHGIPPENVIRDVLLAHQARKHFVTVEEIAALALFLASDAAASITATALAVDGGWTQHQEAGMDRTAGRDPESSDRKLIALALQGGGAHGAFTWGVIDRLLSFVTSLLQGSKIDRPDMKEMLIHSIRSDEAMSALGVSSKLNADWSFLCFLRDEGRARAEVWLHDNFDAIGQRSSIDIRAEFL